MSPSRQLSIDLFYVKLMELYQRNRLFQISLELIRKGSQNVHFQWARSWNDGQYLKFLIRKSNHN
jgi:hypothetical protein